MSERIEAIRGAIAQLDTDNEEHWNADGSPAVEAIEHVLGYDITAEERDEAVAANQAEVAPGVTESGDTSGEGETDAPAPSAPSEPEGSEALDGEEEEGDTGPNLETVGLKGDALYVGKIVKVDKRAGGAGTAIITFENGETQVKGIGWVNNHNATVGSYYLVTDTGACTCVSSLVYNSIFC